MSVSVSMSDDQSSESTTNHNQNVQAELDRVNTKFCEVCCHMCATDAAKARNCCQASNEQCQSCCTNSCIDHAKTVLLAWVVIISAVCISGCLTYLWAVPYSNRVAHILWPDIECQNIWLSCDSPDPVTFTGFLVHISTIDMFFLGVAFMLVFFLTDNKFPVSDAVSDTKMRKCKLVRNNKKCCFPVVLRRGINGNMFVAGLILMLVSICVTTIIISLYIGPLLAFNTLGQCAQFKGAIRGYRQFPDSECWVFQQNGDPVPGANGWLPYIWGVPNSSNNMQCSWCLDIGFAIVFLSIFGFLILCFVCVCIGFCLYGKYQTSKEIVLAVKRDQILEFDSESRTTDI